MNKFLKLLGFSNPKYYDLITKLIVGVGLTLVSRPVWVEILYYTLDIPKFNIIGKSDPYWGTGLIIIGLTYNTIQRYFDWIFPIDNLPAFKNTSLKQFNSFEELVQELYPLLKDNEYIFKTMGPNSSANSEGPVRYDLGLWNNLKSDIIVPNNSKIKELIDLNKTIIPSIHEEIFNKMIQHIIAFSNHVKDQKLSYTDYQFPNGFDELIKNSCFESAKESLQIKIQIKWFKKKTKRLKLLEAYIFGSLIFAPTKARDTDIVFLTENRTSEELIRFSKKIRTLKSDFKIKFKRVLHLTIFNQKETAEYETFINKNHYKINLNG